MTGAGYLVFRSFQLDPVKKRLWQGKKEVKLRPMAVAVLQVLIEHAGKVIPKEDLLKQVWAGTYVTKTALKVCIREIRQALRDKVTAPRYIETVGQEGYRFVGHTDTGKPNHTSSSIHTEVEPVVGREQDMAQLQQWLIEAKRGVRQCVFLTGEAGVGKTTLVDLFLARLRPDGSTRVGYGQCVEQYGEGEAYLPVLEAVGRLCREPGSAQLMALLRRYAPTWLVQMPSLLAEAELASLQQNVQGMTRQRMLREIAEAIEALTAEHLLVLVLHDLQWSDYSTLELIAYLARRRERARLMILGTYRPTDIAPSHPLKGIHQELHAHGQCKELLVNLLTESEVSTYLAKRFLASSAPRELAKVIHQRTDGNALFMVQLVNSLASRLQAKKTDGLWKKEEAEEVCLPDTLRQLIEYKLEKLHPEERRLLEAASVTGREFGAAAVAAAVGEEAVQIEERCAELVRGHQFIQLTGTSEWPDGTITTRYRFSHALYQEVLYHQLMPGKKTYLHRVVGERLEQGYCDRRPEFAAELSMHFERGRDYLRAIQYLGQAAEHATRQCAYHETVHYLLRALELLKTLPDTLERAGQELRLQINLGVSLMATKGYASPEAKQAYDRACALCQQGSQTPQLVPVLRGLAAFSYVRAELQTARTLGEQALSLARQQQNEDLLLEAYQEMGGTLFNLGEFAAALTHLEQGFVRYDRQKHRSHTALYGQDPGVSCLSRLATTLWFLGYPDQALIKNQEALDLAYELSHPHSLAYALNFAAGLHQLCGQGQMCQERAEAAIKLAAEHGFPIWAAMGAVFRGWALAAQGQTEKGIAEMHEGLAFWRAVGAEISVPYFLAFLAEAYAKGGQTGKGLSLVAEAQALVHKTQDCWWEAELYRLNGELLKQQTKEEGRKVNVDEEAAECFYRARTLARRQRATILELRAALSLGQLWLRQGQYAEARQLLAETYSWFTEGFHTADLQKAKAFLAELDAHIVTRNPYDPGTISIEGKHGSLMKQ